MEVSILHHYGGMSSIPGHPSNSITYCSDANNSKSIQIVSWREHHAFLSSSFSIPVGRVTYTSGWHLMMSLHGRCVTQHCDSLGKITSVLDRGKLSLPEGLDFPFCCLPSVGEFSCGQLGCSAPATVHRRICWQQNSRISCTARLSLFLSQFSALHSHSRLCSCLSYTVSDSICLPLLPHYTSSSPALVSLPLPGG